MGQYYMPAVIDTKRHICRYLYSHEYDNGLKLMEHSYIGNAFVNAVQSQILDNPMQVAWIGDYSRDRFHDPYESILPRKKFLRIWNRCWKDGHEDEDQHFKIKPDPIGGFDMEHIDGWYLVNHSKKTFIDLAAYAARNKWHEEGEWRKEHYSYDMCIHPLPLLTACGNGRGGGDYYANNPDFDEVGSWAFDVIELTRSKPEGYEPVMYHFKEVG